MAGVVLTEMLSDIIEYLFIAGRLAKACDLANANLRLGSD